MEYETDLKRSLTQKVLALYVHGLLSPDLDAGNMIAVFDIVEHNPDGVSRLRRLEEERCVVTLSPEEKAFAVELLNDFRSDRNSENQYTKIAAQDGWIRMSYPDSLPDLTQVHKTYLVYCEKSDIVYRKPKRGELLMKMFIAGEATHYKDEK